MLKYTIASLRVIADDLKKWYNFFRYGSLVLTSIYFIYALISQTGNVIANGILATLFVMYTIFDFATHKRKIKTARKVVTRFYKWSRIGINTFTLGAMIYGIYETSTHVSAMSIILATLMIILWVIQVLLEIVSEIVQDKFDMLVEAVKQDWTDFIDTLKSPLTTIGNAIKKVRGEEIAPPPKKSKVINFLDDKIKEYKTKKQSNIDTK